MVYPGLPRSHYLGIARWWAVWSILAAAVSTLFIGQIKDYIEYCLSLLCFLGMPIYLGVVWRRANQTGMWLSLILGMGSFLAILLWPTRGGSLLGDPDTAFVARVFVSTGLSLIGMILGSLLGRPEAADKLNRFYVILNTPIGSEQRLIDAGIRLPALIDAGLTEEGPEQLRTGVLAELYRADCRQKIFGFDSGIEIRRERLGWYLPGFISISLQCIALVVLTWLLTRVLFVWW